VNLILLNKLLVIYSSFDSVNQLNTLKGVSTIMSSEITIVGNLGKDAELRFMPNGDPVTSFSICSNEYSRAGETQTWYNVSLFGNSEDFGQYLTKGTGLYLKGRLNVKPWEGRDGKTRVSLNVNTNRVEFTGGKRSASQAAAPAQGDEAPADVTDAPPPDLSDNDIPF
jgi:single-strand DNA-binding protein